MTILILLFLSLSVRADAPREIAIPKGVHKLLKTFEPSGAVYLKDLDSYLVVVDDTDKKSRALIFLMDRNGKVRDEAFEIEGAAKAADMESVSVDERGRVYILPSLGLTKKGKSKDERNTMLRIAREGTAFTLQDSVDLREPLVAAIQANPDLKSLHAALEDLDVESHWVFQDRLLIGLKNPQPVAGTALILDLGPVDQIFATKKIAKVSVWNILNFKAQSKEDDVLSEILHKDGVWYFTTTTPDDHGRLWKMEGNRLSVLKTYKTERPEALAAPAGGGILILFDQGKGAPLFSFENGL